MRATGDVKPIDTLGRVIVPQHLRKVLNLSLPDKVEYFIENDNIIIKKYSPACVFCDNTEEIIIFNNKKVCKSCMLQLGGQHE